MMFTFNVFKSSMRLIITIGVFVFISCGNRGTEKKSFWQKQQTNFKYTNKSAFFSDSALLVDLKHLKKLPLKVKPWIDSVYLYSWQESNAKNVEFTVVGMEGKYGPGIFYIIFNKQDSLLSIKRIAGSDDEGDSWLNFGSVFISRDTFQEISDEEFKSLNKKEKFKLNRRLPIHVIRSDGSILVIINMQYE